MASSNRAFVLRHTRLRPVPGLEEVRFRLADEVLPLWHAVQVETDDPDAGLPYWAFAWGGGLAIGPEGRTVELLAGGGVDRHPRGRRPGRGTGAPLDLADVRVGLLYRHRERVADEPDSGHAEAS